MRLSLESDQATLASPIERHRSWVLAASVVAPLVASAVLSLFRESVTAVTAVLVLVLLVIAAASTGLRVAGIVAAVSSGVWFDFFLTKPYGSLSINDANDVEAAVLLVVIGAAVTEVALWGHRQQARANRRAGYLDGVLGTAEIVTLRSHPRRPGHARRGADRQILDVHRCRYVAGPLRDERVPVLSHQGQVTRRGHDIDVDRNGLPTDDDIALVVMGGDDTLGYFLLTSASSIARPTLEQRKVAVLLADQAGQVLADPRP